MIQDYQADHRKDLKVYHHQNLSLLSVRTTEQG